MVVQVVVEDLMTLQGRWEILHQHHHHKAILVAIMDLPMVAAEAAVPVLRVQMEQVMLVVLVELVLKFLLHLEILRVLQQTHQIQNHLKGVVD
jgi:hypothetical protein